VTVRTPHDATRDSFSISMPTVKSRSTAPLIACTSGPMSTSRSVTCARQALATRRSPRKNEPLFTRTL
jgi:hypothetical protein